MPVTLTDDPSQFNPIVVPLSGEGRTASSLQGPFQQLANRTANLNSKVTGFRQSTRCLTIAAMQAIIPASRTDGDSAYVDGHGVYEFLAASTLTADGEYVVTPAAGSGQWVSDFYARRGQPNGVPAADSTGRAPGANVRNGIVATAFSLLTTPFTTNSGSFVSVASGSTLITLPNLVVGDSIFVTGKLTAGTIASSDSLWVQAWLVGGGGGTHILDISITDGLAYAGAMFPMATQFVVVAAGTHTIEWQVHCEVSGPNTVALATINAFVVRP